MFPSAAKPLTASTALSVLDIDMIRKEIRLAWRKHVQSEDLWSIARLDAVAFALSGIACYDTKICACDGEDCAAVFCVWIKLMLLGLRVRCGDHVGHSDKGEMRKEARQGREMDLYKMCKTSEGPRNSPLRNLGAFSRGNVHSCHQSRSDLESSTCPELSPAALSAILPFISSHTLRTAHNLASSCSSRLAESTIHVSSLLPPFGVLNSLSIHSADVSPSSRNPNP